METTSTAAGFGQLAGSFVAFAFSSAGKPDLEAPASGVDGREDDAATFELEGVESDEEQPT
jgi:hypothetical protein